MGRINTIRPSNLSKQQSEAVQARLMSACDARVLDLADVLHEVIRTRHHIRCLNTRISGGVGWRDLMSSGDRRRLLAKPAPGSHQPGPVGDPKSKPSGRR